MQQFVLALLLSFGAASSALAQVSVHEPWIRATVPGQTSTGAFMQLRAEKGARLVQARSPVAGMVQIHQMAMSGNVMKMHPVKAVELPAGKTVDLAPGGYHIMLMGLKKQIKAGDSVPLTLVLDDASGKRETVEVKALARPLGAAGSMTMRKH